MTEILQRILPTVQKPARYTGGEYNEIKKNPVDRKRRMKYDTEYSRTSRA